jgi:hypothetical protein
MYEAGLLEATHNRVHCISDCRFLQIVFVKEFNFTFKT